MDERHNKSSAVTGTYRATAPIPHERREDLRTLVTLSGARSFSDLIDLLVQRPEQAGRALAPIVDEIVGQGRKREAIEKVRATALKAGLTQKDLEAVFNGWQVQTPIP